MRQANNDINVINVETTTYVEQRISALVKLILGKIVIIKSLKLVLREILYSSSHQILCLILYFDSLYNVFLLIFNYTLIILLYLYFVLDYILISF